MLILTEVALISNWASSSSAGRSTAEYHGETGPLDLFFGRELRSDAQSGGAAKRFLRDFSTTMWRGLLITFPSGFYLQHREYQFGWTYAVAGAAMPALFAAGAAIDSSSGGGGGGGGAAGATGWSEFLFGTWLWAILLLLARPSAESCPIPYLPLMKLLGRLGVATAVIFFVCSVFYGTVSQCNTDEWAVNLLGLWGSTIGLALLLVATCMPAWASRCHRNRGRYGYGYAAKDAHPGVPNNNYAKINSDDGQYTASSSSGANNNGTIAQPVWQSFAGNDTTTFEGGHNGSVFFGSRSGHAHTNKSR